MDPVLEGFFLGMFFMLLFIVFIALCVVAVDIIARFHKPKKAISFRKKKQFGFANCEFETLAEKKGLAEKKEDD